MSFDERCNALKSNPVTAAIMFDRRVKEFHSIVFLGSAQPVGEIIDFFYRLEFQMRGAPHIHGLYWIKGAPVADVDPDEDVSKFIDKYISCLLPGDTKLKSIVEEVQTHRKRHTKSCRKGKKECRFNFAALIFSGQGNYRTQIQA